MRNASRMSRTARNWYRACSMAITALLATLAAWGSPPPGL